MSGGLSPFTLSSAFCVGELPFDISVRAAPQQIFDLVEHPDWAVYGAALVSALIAIVVAFGYIRKRDTK